jgi:CheY-like chemotaxis protein
MSFFFSSPSPAASLAAPPTPPAPGAPHRVVILVVDDSAMIRVAVAKALTAAGYEIIEAENGRKGLETWEQNKAAISLVLSDVFMPELDGLSMARELRRRSRPLPIVLMSSKLDENSRWVAEEAGFRLMPKPFKDAYMLELVARLLRLRTPV